MTSLHGQNMPVGADSQVNEEQVSKRDAKVIINEMNDLARRLVGSVSRVSRPAGVMGFE